MFHLQGHGKTTVLRDLVRNISDELRANVSVIDERGEIASAYKGVPQNNVGIRTDILSNIQKDIGMKMMIRSMAPKVIAADEIGNEADVEAINYALCSGVKGIFTAHGYDLEDLILNNTIQILIDKKVFERIIVLDTIKKGEIQKVYVLDKDTKKYEEVWGAERELGSFSEEWIVNNTKLLRNFDVGATIGRPRSEGITINK